jgi:hypothetical protein
MPKKQNHAETINFLIKSIIVLVVIIGIGLIAIALGRSKNSTSLLDQRKLEAFESVFSKAITDEFSDEEKHTTATVTGLGLSQDDDLYADFTIYYYNDNHEIAYTQNAKVYLQCEHENRTPITGTDDKTGCAFAYTYGDKAEVTK